LDVLKLHKKRFRSTKSKDQELETASRERVIEDKVDRQGDGEEEDHWVGE
jgi:hypothetical protein